MNPGRLIMQYAAQNLIPSTTELGGKSPNIFLADVMDADDAFLDKAIEGLVLYAFTKGEVCTRPSGRSSRSRSTTPSWSTAWNGSSASTGQPRAGLGVVPLVVAACTAVAGRHVRARSS